MKFLSYCRDPALTFVETNFLSHSDMTESVSQSNMLAIFDY